MIVTAKKIMNHEDFNSIEYENIKIYYRGIIFFKGKREGRESIETMARSYRQDGKIPFDKIFGTFTVVINNNDESKLLFTDNSNMQVMYRSKEAISSSFLALLRYKIKNGNDVSFDDEAICNYLSLGRLLYNNTFAKEITLTDSMCYYEMKNDVIIEHKKDIGTLDGKSTILGYQSFFDNISDSLVDRTICQALTGGYDSRLVFACLNKYIDTHPFISGDVDEEKDIIVAKKVAAVGGKNLNQIKTKKPLVSEKLIFKMFESGDGLLPCSNAARYRINDFMETQSNNGFDCLLTGDGGVLHKDWEWMQDLPFYHKRNTNISKFYRQRIAFDRETQNVGPRLAIHLDQQKKVFIKNTAQYIKDINTKSYDYLYYYVNGDKRRDYSLQVGDLYNYAPLMEFELVKYSYNLSRRKRFFYNAMRQVMSQADEKIARVPTVYGTTASGNTFCILRDVFFQVKDYVKKACRLIIRKISNRTVFAGEVLSWSMYDEVARLPLINEAVDYCKNKGFFNLGTNIYFLSERAMDAAIHIYILHKEYSIECDK